MAPKIQDDMWNSKFISEAAKRNYLKEMDNVFTKLVGGGEVTKATAKEIVYKAERKFIEKTPTEVVETQVDDFMSKLKYKVVTDNEV